MRSKQSDTVAKSDLSLKSRSFMNRVNDLLRKMLNRFPEDSMLDIDKRSMIWWMFMSSTVEASVFMGKIYSDNLHSIKNTEDLTMEQMFDISEKLITEQSDEIFWVFQISWESSPWTQLSLVNDEDVISLSRAKVYVFSDSVLCLAKMNQNPTSNSVWKRHLGWFKDSAQSTENQWNSSECFSRIHHIAARRRSPKVHEQNERTWTIPRTNYLHVDVQWHHVVMSRQWNGMYCWFHTCVYISQKRFPAGRWSFLGPGSEKKWYSTYNEWPRGEWDRLAELMVIKFRESGHPVFRATSPFARGMLKTKGGGKLSIHFCADGDTIKTVFRTIISVNQLSNYGAVSDLCEAYSSCRTRTGGPVVAEQSDPLFAPADLFIMTPTPLDWNSCPRKSIVEAQRTRGKASTTRLSERDLYWCKIPENSWSRTIPHDKTYWRVLTNCRASDMSWEYVTTRRQINWLERLDSREHQNWTRVGSHNQLLARWIWSGNQNWICKQRHLSLVGQNFSWIEQVGQTWSTGSTTTTSRRPLQRRRKHLRLQADPRLKQKQEDLLLLAHLQGLCLFLKEYRWILNKEPTPIELTQWQKE